MLYYGNGGPGAATRLLRVDAPEDADLTAWQQAPADKWTARSGWEPFVNAQLDIQQLGEYFMIDADEVPKVQREMTPVAALA
jgi:hypothetical protein